LQGVKISGQDAQGNQVQGNYIGCDKSGQNGLGTQVAGVWVESGATQNTIGGLDQIVGLTPVLAGAANLISGNKSIGVVIHGPTTTNNDIDGNFIGTASDGETALPNGPTAATGAGAGVWIIRAPGNTVASNLISGNNQSGVVITGSTASGNTFSGNIIGLDKNGTAKLPNGGDGVLLYEAPDNMIGSATALRYNVISGNKGDGVDIKGTDATGNLVQFDYIGTDLNGSIALGNGGNGVTILDATGTLIGGLDPANSARDVISGNFANGVSITGGERATANQIVNNFIGTGSDGSTPIPNQVAGVAFSVGSDFNTLVQNVIATNSGAGIRDFNPSVSNLFSQNSIFSNSQLGIDLAARGPTLTGVPVFTSAVTGGNSTTVTGTLASLPDTTYTIEFFSNTVRDPSGYGQGKVYLGSMNVMTDVNGKANFTANFMPAVPVGQFISATSTDPQKRTTEFSADATVVARVGILIPMANNDQYATAENVPLTVTAATGVLSNDSDPNGLPLTAILASGPTNGQLVLNSDGSFTYTPNLDFNGTDIFTYYANDGLATSNLATVTINVTPVNQPPIAEPQMLTVTEDTPDSFSAANLLANDLPGPPNESNQTLTVIGVSNAVNGTVALAGGIVTFTPAAQFTGTASFTYTIQDDGTTNSQPDPKTATATVTVSVVPPVSVATTTVVTGTPNASVYGQPVTFTATVTPASSDLGPATGSVQFLVDGTDFGQPVPISNGTATSASLATLPAGPHTVMAVYSGDGPHTASTGTTTQTVDQAATTTTIASDTPSSVFGQLVTFTAQVVPLSPGEGTPTGMVEFQSVSPDGSIVVTLGTAPLDATGTAVFSMDQLVPASHTIFAVYVGDNNFTTSTSAQLTQTVAPADTQLSLTATNATVVAGGANSFNLSLAIVPPGTGIAAPTGTISIYDTFEGVTTLVTTLVIGQSGTFPAFTAIGTHVLTAVYSGDSNYNGSTSNSVTVTIVPASS
jgi:parallel beta-helix repeat protein